MAHETAHHRFQGNIAEILGKRRFAVVGASRDTTKFGYQVYRTLKGLGYEVYAVNPHAETVDEDPVYPLLDNVPNSIDCVVTVVPPDVTYEIVRQAGQLRIPHMWMQPGSESESAVIEAHAQGIDVVFGGPCIMVEARNRLVRAD
jgi:predicted CoA-binding protein